MSIITVRSRLFPANSASDCLRFFNEIYAYEYTAIKKNRYDTPLTNFYLTIHWHHGGAEKLSIFKRSIKMVDFLRVFSV